MKIPFFKVSTLLTVVLISLNTTGVWAEDGIGNYIKPPETMEECLLRKSGSANASKECENLIYRSGGSQSGCEAANTSFKEAKNKVGDDATTYEIGIMCKTCKGRGKSLPGYCEGAGSAEYSRPRQMSNLLNPYGSQEKVRDRKTSKDQIRKARSCPMVAESLADELKERIEKFDDRVETLKERIETTQQEIADATTAIKEAEAKYKNEDVPRIEKEKETKRKEFDRKNKLNTQSMDKEYQAMNNEINKLAAEMQELEFQRNNSILAIRRECRDAARKRVQDELQVRREKYLTNSLSYKSMNEHFNNVGRPLAQKSAEKAADYYSLCLRQNNDRFQSITADYARRRDQINTAVNSIKQQQSKLIQEVGGIEMQEEAKAELQEIFTDYKADLEKAYGDYMNEVQKQSEILRQKQQKLQELQVELQEKEDLLSHEQQVLGMADEAASDSPTDRDSGSDFLAEFDALSSASSSMYNTCGCKDPTTSGASAEECKAAMKAMCNTATNPKFSDCKMPDQLLINNIKSKGRSKR